MARRVRSGRGRSLGRVEQPVERVLPLWQRCRIRQPALQHRRSTCTTNDTKAHRASLWHTRARCCLEIEKGLQKWATGGGGGSGGGSFAAAFFLRAPFSGRSVPRVSENVRRISTHPPALQLDTASQRSFTLCTRILCRTRRAHFIYILRSPCLTQLSIFVLFTIIEFG